MWRHNYVIDCNEYLIFTSSESINPWVYSMQFLFKSTNNLWRYERKCEWVFFSEHSLQNPYIVAILLSFSLSCHLVAPVVCPVSLLRLSRYYVIHFNVTYMWINACYNHCTVKKCHWCSVVFSNRWWRRSSIWRRTLSAATTSTFWCRLVSSEPGCREARTRPVLATSSQCSGLFIWFSLSLLLAVDLYSLQLILPHEVLPPNAVMLWAALHPQLNLNVTETF